MASNPNPSRNPAPLWYLWERLHLLEPHSQLGGIYAFKSGYHSTRADNQRNWPSDYSIIHPRDKGGPADKSAALDWTFPDAQAGNYATISLYTKRLLASARDRNDPRLDGLREFFGQADNDLEVEGWDCRYGVPASSGPTHLWHIHFSFDRVLMASLKVGKAIMDNVLSVLRGQTVAQWRGEELSLLLIQEEGIPGVYATDGLTYRWVRSRAAVNAVKPLALNGGAITKVPVGSLSNYGFLVGEAPPK